MELHELQVEQFEPLVGQDFTVSLPGYPGSYTFTLVTAQTSKFPPHRRDARKPFSLMFRPPEGLNFPQAVYHVEHPALGTLPILVVPVLVAEDGRLMQAVFS